MWLGADVNPLHTDNFERVSFGPILYEARKLNMQIHTRYEVADHASESIVRIVNDEPFDFLLVSAGISMSGRGFFEVFDRTTDLADTESPVENLHQHLVVENEIVRISLIGNRQ